MREQQADAAELILQRQGFGLELDAVVAEDPRPHVPFGGRLHVRVAELEHDLGIAQREAVLVGDASSQDEGVVVEPEVRGVEEEHLADLQRRVHELLGGEA